MRRKSQIFSNRTCILPTHLYFGTSIGVTPFEFCREFWSQKTRASGLSRGVVCVILRVAVSVEHRLVADERMDR